MGVGNLKTAQDHIRTAYAKEPNNPTYQNAYNDIMNGINPAEFNPFSAFAGFGSYQTQNQPNEQGYTPRGKNRGCLSKIFRLFLIIIIVRLIFRFIFSTFIYPTNSTRNHQSQSYSNSQQYGSSDSANYFGENYGEGGTF
jgi:hypothetical protein